MSQADTVAELGYVHQDLKTYADAGAFDVWIAQVRAHGVAARARRHVSVIVRGALDTLRPLVVALHR